MKFYFLFFIFVALITSIGEARTNDSLSLRTNQSYSTTYKYLNQCVNNGNTIEICSTKLLVTLGYDVTTTHNQNYPVRIASWDNALRNCMKKFSMTDCLMDFIGHKDETNPVPDTFEYTETNVSI